MREEVQAGLERVSKIGPLLVSLSFSAFNTLWRSFCFSCWEERAAAHLDWLKSKVLLTLVPGLPLTPYSQVYSLRLLDGSEGRVVVQATSPSRTSATANPSLRVSLPPSPSLDYPLSLSRCSLNNIILPWTLDSRADLRIQCDAICVS